MLEGSRRRFDSAQLHNYNFIWGEWKVSRFDSGVRWVRGVGSIPTLFGERLQI